MSGPTGLTAHRHPVSTGALDGVVVHGERLDLLASGLMRIRGAPSPDGMGVMTATMTDAEAAAIARAMLRIESELALHDADVLADGSQPRSAGRRQVRALTLLTERVTSALVGVASATRARAS